WDEPTTRVRRNPPRHRAANALVNGSIEICPLCGESRRGNSVHACLRGRNFGRSWEITHVAAGPHPGGGAGGGGCLPRRPAADERDGERRTGRSRRPSGGLRWWWGARPVLSLEA